MIIVIDVGNTNITIGMFKGEKIVGKLPYDHSDGQDFRRIWRYDPGVFN